MKIKQLTILIIILLTSICFSSCANAALIQYVPSIEINNITYTINDIDWIELRIEECNKNMNHAHEIAENARHLGYSEDSEYIQMAQLDWGKYNEQRNEYENILIQLEQLCDSYTEEDVYLLGKLIYAEAGASYCSDELQLMVGNVVINRLESGYWGDTLEEVIFAEGQYSPTFDTEKWNNIIPDERSLNHAERILRGERWCPKNIIFQANFKQGSGVFWKCTDGPNDMYFCYE